MAKGVIEGVVDLADSEPEARRGGAVDDQISLEPLLLLVEINIGQQRKFLQSGFDLRALLVDVVGVVSQ